MKTTTQPTDLRDTADSLGVTYPRVWNPRDAHAEIRRGALEKAAHWLSEVESGRGYPSTLEYVSDLMALVHAVDEHRSTAFAVATRASVADVAVALTGRSA